MDFSASAATKDAARLRRRRFCTPPRFFSTLPYTRVLRVGSSGENLLVPGVRRQIVQRLFRRSSRFPHALQLRSDHL